MLADKPFISKLMIFLGLCLFCISVFTFLGFSLVTLVFHLDLINDPALLSQYELPGVMNALKVMQTFSALGLFIVPAILASWLFSDKPAAYVYLLKPPTFTATLLVIVILFSCLPIINWLVFLNQQMSLPAIFSGIEDMNVWYKNV